MLKKSLNEFNRNVFEDIGELCPILTAGDKKTGFNAMTVSWGGLGVLWGKNVCFLFVRKSRYTHKFTEESDNITLSFLTDEYKEAKALFGKTSGRDVNKFEESKLHPTYDFDYMGWYVKEASYVLKLKKLYSMDIDYKLLPNDIKDKFYADGDSHTMYVCQINQYLVNEN